MIKLEFSKGEWYFLLLQLESIIRDNPSNHIAKILLERMWENKPDLSDIKAYVKAEFEREYESIWMDSYNKT